MQRAYAVYNHALTAAAQAKAANCQSFACDLILHARPFGIVYANTTTLIKYRKYLWKIRRVKADEPFTA